MVRSIQSDMPLSLPKSLLFCALLLPLPGCAGGSWQATPGSPVTVSAVALPELSEPASTDGNLLAASAANVPGSDREIVPSRLLPELDFPEIEPGILSDPARESEPAEPEAFPESTDNLWDRLNRGFRLGNLEELPGRVEKFERRYGSYPMYFERLGDRAYWFLHYILEEVESRDMPTEIAILPAIESAFRPDATSRARAAGMWQFISATGRRYGLRQDWWMDARRDLVHSTRAALDYLEYLSQEFDGDWELALAAYNAGEGAVRRQIRRNRNRNLPTTYAHLKLKRETREYVPRLMAVRNILRDPEKYGIALKPLENRPTLRVIDLEIQTDISVAASFLSLTLKQLHFLNLGYKRRVTPPNGPHHLVVPADESQALLEGLAGLTPTQRLQWAHHKVKSGEYLGKIARLHGVSIRSIRQVNRLKSDLIHPGQELRIPLSAGAIQYAGPTWGSGSGETVTHLVVPGDSLWKISRIYGARLDDLLQWNQLTRSTILHPGQSIIVSP